MLWHDASRFSAAGVSHRHPVQQDLRGRLLELQEAVLLCAPGESPHIPLWKDTPNLLGLHSLRGCKVVQQHAMHSVARNVRGSNLRLQPHSGFFTLFTSPSRNWP